MGRTILLTALAALDRATVEKWHRDATYWPEFRALAEDWRRKEKALQQIASLPMFAKRASAVAIARAALAPQAEEEKPCADRNCTLPGDHEGQHFDARDGKWWT